MVTVQNSVFTMVLKRGVGDVAKAAQGHRRCVEKSKTERESV